MFLFNEKVLILKQERGYTFVNASNHEEMQIKCEFNPKKADNLKQ
jgi:hypothetical protein